LLYHATEADHVGGENHGEAPLDRLFHYAGNRYPSAQAAELYFGSAKVSIGRTSGLGLGRVKTLPRGLEVPAGSIDWRSEQQTALSATTEVVGSCSGTRRGL
jgi:hypothetical protein